MYLTDAYSTLTKWAFPAGAMLSAGEYRIVWLDGEPGETIGTELHASFRLSANGSIALVRMQNGEAAVVDYINFTSAIANTSIGASPNGQVDLRTTMTPTPGGPNSSAQANRPPSIAAIPNQSVVEGTQLQFTINASDPDAGQSLGFSMQGAPAGASLSAGGVFTWTPTEAQAPGSQTVTIIVTDNGTPALSATNSFQLSATEVNAAPAIQPVADRTVDEGNLVAFNVAASDTDLPAQTLSFALQNAPAGATISGAGAFTWTPAEAQGPGSYRISVVVTDNGSPVAAETNTFTIIVQEVNAAPTVAGIAEQTVSAGTAVSLTVVGSDSDVPAQQLSYTLEAGAPAGASIAAGTGAFSWTPAQAQAGTTNVITVRVSDNGSPSLSVTTSFRIVVRAAPAAPPNITAGIAQGRCVLSWSTQAGTRYRIQFKDLLVGASWQTLSDVTGDGHSMTFTDPGTPQTRFYRIEVLP
jgi:hypothetical protein